jgi:hypothetical protein
MTTYLGSVEQHSAPLREPGGQRPVPSQVPRSRPTRQPRPPAASWEGAAACRTRRSAAVSRLPRARLTALGSGLLAVLLMAVAGWLVQLLLSGSPTVYGVCFVVVCVASALWVRAADLFTAPVAAPIACAVGMIFISGGSDGFSGKAMGVVTALAVNAGWVYGGTLAALLTAVGRRWVLVMRRRAGRRSSGPAT